MMKICNYFFFIWIFFSTTLPILGAPSKQADLESLFSQEVTIEHSSIGHDNNPREYISFEQIKQQKYALEALGKPASDLEVLISYERGGAFLGAQLSHEIAKIRNSPLPLIHITFTKSFRYLACEGASNTKHKFEYSKKHDTKSMAEYIRQLIRDGGFSKVGFSEVNMGGTSIKLFCNAIISEHRKYPFLFGQSSNPKIDVFCLKERSEGLLDQQHNFDRKLEKFPWGELGQNGSVLPDRTIGTYYIIEVPRLIGEDVNKYVTDGPSPLYTNPDDESSFTPIQMTGMTSNKMTGLTIGEGLVGSLVLIDGQGTKYEIRHEVDKGHERISPRTLLLQLIQNYTPSKDSSNTADLPLKTLHEKAPQTKTSKPRKSQKTQLKISVSIPSLRALYSEIDEHKIDPPECVVIDIEDVIYERAPTNENAGDKRGFVNSNDFKAFLETAWARNLPLFLCSTRLKSQSTWLKRFNERVQKEIFSEWPDLFPEISKEENEDYTVYHFSPRYVTSEITGSVDTHTSVSMSKTLEWLARKYTNIVFVSNFRFSELNLKMEANSSVILADFISGRKFLKYADPIQNTNLKKPRAEKHTQSLIYKKSKKYSKDFSSLDIININELGDFYEKFDAERLEIPACIALDVDGVFYDERSKAIKNPQMLKEFLEESKSRDVKVVLCSARLVHGSSWVQKLNGYLTKIYSEWPSINEEKDTLFKYDIEGQEYFIYSPSSCIVTATQISASGNSGKIRKDIAIQFLAKKFPSGAPIAFIDDRHRNHWKVKNSTKDLNLSFVLCG
jgi:hypothetical protein